MTLDELSNIYQTYHNRPLGDGLQYLGGENGDWSRMSAQDFVKNVVIPSAEFKRNNPAINSDAAFQASKIYAPQRDLALQDIQSTAKDYDIQETGINRQYDTLGTELAKQADISTKALQEKYNSLGLLQSGMTASGLGDIQSTLMQKKGQSEQDRADRLAQLALQRAGLTTKELSVKKEYEQNMNDYVAKLMQSQQEQEVAAQKAQQEAALKAIDYSLKLPQGQTVDVPGLGTITGVKQETSKSTSKTATTKAPTQTQIKQSAKEDIESNFKYYADNNMSPQEGWTESVLIPKLQAAYPELSFQEIAKMVYDQRKPYEGTIF